MPDPVDLGVFLAVAVVVSALWGSSLWYFDERSSALRRGVFLAMRFTRRQAGELRSLLLSAIYFGLGLLATAVLAAAYRLDVTEIGALSITGLVLSVLGVVGAISLTNLLVDLACHARRPGTAMPFAELREIPWMKGLRELATAMVPLVAAAAGMVEELFFRGVVLFVMMDRLLLAPWLAVVLAGVLFCLQQLIQLRTAFQMLVIGSGCVAISVIGGLLVVLTGSVVPAVLCHGSFVIFFMARGDRGAAAVPGGMR